METAKERIDRIDDELVALQIPVDPPISQLDLSFVQIEATLATAKAIRELVVELRELRGDE